MPKLYDYAESVEVIAKRILPTYHAELATARMLYMFVDKASMKGGRPVLGKAKKISGALEFLLEKDFMIEIPSDQWNNLNENQRLALIDHMLERCTGVEDDDENSSTRGSMKWMIREPDVQEFATILSRHGVWNDGLSSFVEVAQRINIDAQVQDVVDSETVTTVTT